MMTLRMSALILTLMLCLLVPSARAANNTVREPVDGCNSQYTGNCATLRDNLKFYMDVHRRGGAVNPSYLFKTFWDNTVKPGFDLALLKIVHGIDTQKAAIGTFREAQDNVRAIGSLQEATAHAARDYAPSETLCRFGTLTQSLASDDAKMRTTQMTLAANGLNRELGAQNSPSQSGAANDRVSRMNNFISEYCDRSNGSLDLMCGANPQRVFPAVSRDSRYNRDINFTRTMDSDKTLSAQYTDNTGAFQPNEQDISMLGNNLYGSKQFSGRMTEKQLKSLAGQDAYLNSRSVASTRSLPMNTYAAIAAMKTQGSGSTRRYMKDVLTQLGIPDDQINSALGDKPSYYAQMDVLTKKLYQQPSFYVNLMEGNSNVARQSDAMEGLELSQDRDIYNSMRRSEMLLSLLIQLESRKELDDVVEER